MILLLQSLNVLSNSHYVYLGDCLYDGDVGVQHEFNSLIFESVLHVRITAICYVDEFGVVGEIREDHVST